MKTQIELQTVLNKKSLFLKRSLRYWLETEKWPRKSKAVLQASKSMLKRFVVCYHKLNINHATLA